MVMMEACVHVVSTRKVDDLAKALGVDSGIPNFRVSRVCSDSDCDAQALRRRELPERPTLKCFSTPPTAKPGLAGC